MTGNRIDIAGAFRIVGWRDVPAGGRVLFALDDTGRDYERIFDGYRAIIELPLFSANRKKFTCHPTGIQ